MIAITLTGLLTVFRTPTPPLPPLRTTGDILSDIDHQAGRLAMLRDRAVELLKEMESDDHPQ